MSSSLNKSKQMPDYIVGIGASAGGLEALQKLLSALPANTGFPYIIIQHLSPDYKSLLSEILGKYTEMPVVQVEDGMEIEPDCVYVIQPGKNMRLSGGKLLLSSQKERELNLPIDMFFRSLAEEAGSRAIAIVLSGTGSDGSNGIKAIKENDGLILVQDIDSAKFDGMPRSAVRTGIVDAQFTPENIALELMHISSAAVRISEPLKTERQIDDELMKKIYIILRKISNVNFTHYKLSTILRRIERRMMLTHKELLTDYVDFLYESPDEVKALSKEVLIGVTNFFRDPEFFQSLKDKAIQDILVRSSPEDAVRVWVAGCSTGEEAYSIAILFCEAMETLKIKRTVKIFATDLDVESITVAGKGIYNDNIIESVSPVRLSRYFSRQNNTYTVNRDIRKMIVFSPHNVFQDPPFGRLDLISCRNMLIYFQPVLQNDLFNIFHSALKDGGFLFLGKSEAIGAYTEAFPVIDATAKIFTHRGDIKIAGAKTVPFLQTTFLEEDYSNGIDERYARKALTGDITASDEESVDTSLLEQFMPACLVINDKNEIVHTYGESSNYIHFSVGKFSNMLFDIVTEALKVPVSTILKEARERNQKVQYKNICFTGEHDIGEINLTAMPVSKKSGSRDTRSLFAIVFSEIKQRGEMENAVPYEIDRIASQRITDLEQELGEVQGSLDRSIAEQECVNEELQAANEELLTANEELQSSNEELQSVNEELYTVNSEYQQKLAELAEMNDDIANFLSSTLIGIIFVDNKLNIRRYTDYVTTEFSVMDHDIGRSLKFISYHFPTVDISEICDNVLKTLVPDEREITTSKKKVFFMRVAPYRSIENKILGCVITLVDVTKQKQGLVKLQNTEERLNLLKQSNDAKNDYLSHIAHEIKAPMEVVSSLTKLATDNIGKPEVIRDSLGRITDSIEYITGIITEISEASENEQLLAERISEPFELRDIISSVDTFIKEYTDKTGQTFRILMDDDFAPKYIGNGTAVQQILCNFLNTTAKSASSNAVITLKAFEAEQDRNTVSLCFEINDSSSSAANDLTAEASEDGTPNRPSTGLGMSMAYSLIRSMDGNVTVDSNPQAGSTFTIVIKLGKYIKRKSPNKDTASVSGELAGRHILMAEDNALNRMILGVLLKNEGITYAEAVDGSEAVKMFIDAPAYTYDCILMDMRMPKVDGIRATAFIRESGKEDAQTVPIIGVSANAFADDIRQAEIAGLDDYTTKPIDKEKLLSVIRKHILTEK